MQDDVQERPERGVRRSLRRALRAALAVALLVAAAWMLRGRWLPPLAARVVGRVLDADIAIAELTTRGFDSLEARGIRAAARDGSWVLDLASLDARLAPGRLFTDPLSAFPRVELRGLDVRSFPGVTRSAGEPFTWPESLPEVEISDARFERVIADGGRVSLEGVALGIPADGRDAWIRAEHARLAQTPWGRDENDLEARFSFDRGRVELVHLSFDGSEALRDSTVDLTGIGSGLVGFDVTLPAVAARVRGTITPESLELSGSVADLDLAGLPRRIVPELLEDVSGRMDGRFDLVLPIDAPEAFRVDFDVAVRSPCLAGRTVERLEVRGELDGSVLRLASLQAERGADRVRGDRIEIPLAGDDFEQQLRSVRGNVEADLSNLPEWLGVGVPEVPPHRLECAVRLTEDGVAVDRARLDTAGGVFRVRRGTVAWGARAGRALEDARFDLDCDLDFADLSALGELVDERAWSGSLRGLLRLEGSASDPAGRFDLVGESVVIAGIELGRGSIRARVTPDRLTIEELAAQTPYGSLSGSGSLLLAGREIEAASLVFEAQEIEHILPGRVDGGSVRIAAELSGTLDRPVAEGVLTASDLRRGDWNLEELVVLGRFESDRLVLREVRARTTEADLRLAATMETPRPGAPIVARVESLRLESRREPGHALELEGPVGLRYEQGRFLAEEFVLAGSAGRFRGEVEVDPDRWRVRLNAERFDDASLVATWLPGGVSFASAEGVVEIAREGEALEAHADVTVSRLHWTGHGDPLDLRVKASWSADQLAIETLAITGKDGHLRLAGSVPIAPFAWPEPACLPAGPVDLRVELDWSPAEPLALSALGGTSLEGSLSARLALEGTWDEPTLRLEAESERIAIRGEATEGWSPSPVSARTKVVFGRSLRSSEFRADSEDGAHLEFSGGAAVDFAPRRWLAEGLPEPADIPLDLVVEASLPDLSRFAWLFPTGSRVAGKVRGQARVVGTAALPLASGEVELSGGEWRLQDSLAGVTDLHGRMRIESGRATLEELAGEYGRGPIRIGGTIDWSTPGWPARIELQGERLLLARSDELRLRADADLVFEGPLGQATAERPHLRGTLRLRDGRYERRLDLLDSVRSAGRRRTISGPREVSLFSLTVEPLASAELDVRISGDPIEVDGNLVRARITPALVLQGTGRAPDLTGDLFVARGAVLVPAGIVEVRSGSISFTRAEPLVPQVNLLGQARLAGYDLTVRARGPYDDVDVLLTSSPSLSQSDLMRLLLSGRVPASGQGTEASRQTMQTLATFFGRDYLTRYLDEEFGSSGTSFLSRTEFQQGRDVTRSGGQTAEVSVRLSPGEEGERRSIYLRGENDVYDRTNFGLRIVFRFP